MVVKAPGGWPTADPASVLGKGFLFHLNLQSWGNCADTHGKDYLHVDDEREEEDELATDKALQLAAARVDPAVHARGAVWSSPRTFAGVVASCKTASEVGGVPAVFFKKPLRRLASHVGGSDAEPTDVESAWSDAPSIPWPDAVRNMTERFETEHAARAVTVSDKVEYCSKVRLPRALDVRCRSEGASRRTGRRAARRDRACHAERTAAQRRGKHAAGDRQVCRNRRRAVVPLRRGAEWQLRALRGGPGQQAPARGPEAGLTPG